MFLTSKQGILATLVMLVIAITIVDTAVEICPESRCPGPLPQMQQIVAGDRVIEYFFNTSLHMSNIYWCINGSHALNPALFTKFDKNKSNDDVLLYNNPSHGDQANGLTLYAIEGDSDCATNTNLITVLSDVGTISARLVLIHIVEASCPLLPHPINGKVLHVTDRTANYSCNTGFNVNGNSTLTCVTKVDEQVGEWIGSPPTCEPITCERPSIANGTVGYCDDVQEPNRIPFGAIATFYCAEGHNLSDNTTLRCTYGISAENSSNENGNWSKTLPTCEALQPITTASTPTDPPSTTSTTLPGTTSTSAPLETDHQLIINITDPEGISIIVLALIVGLVLGVFAASLVCYVCPKRASTIHPILGTDRVETNRMENEDNMKGIDDSLKL